MGNLHTTITFENKSGAPRDRVVNSFAFVTPAAPTDFDMLNIEAALLAFYNTAGTGGTNAIGKYLSGALSRSIKPVVRHYDVTAHLAGTAAGSPVRVSDLADFLTTPIATNNLPNEVSVSLSFASDYGSDVEFAPGSRPRSRDRGRVYLGPLTLGAVATNGTTGRCFVEAGFQADIVAAASDLLTDADTQWSVWTRRGAAFKQVTRLWVDDEFDTQRRRGGVTTNRLVFP